MKRPLQLGGAFLWDIIKIFMDSCKMDVRNSPILFLTSLL